MYLHFLFLGFCLAGPFYLSYGSFLYSVKGLIQCNMDSYIVTNHKESTVYCYGKKVCWLNYFNNLSYVCIKKQYGVSNCRGLRQVGTQNAVIQQSGCYVSKAELKIGITVLGYQNNIAHIFLLHSKMYIYRGKAETCVAFCYFKCEKMCSLVVDEDSWFLVKYSNYETEDFGEFLVDMNQETITGNRIGNTGYPITMAPTEMSIKKDTSYPTTMAPTERILSIKTVLLAIVVVLMVVIVLMCLFFLVFYRMKLRSFKQTPNVKLTNTNNEFPLSENVAIDPGSHENSNTTEDYGFNGYVDFHTDDDCMVTTASEVQSWQRTEGPLDEHQYSFVS